MKILKLDRNETELKMSEINNASSSINLSSLPEDGIISVYKSSRNGDFLCLHGYTYQINLRLVNKIKWKCKENRNEPGCGAKIYTTKNLGTDETPVYQYLESNRIEHSHNGNYDEQKVSTFVSEFKEIGKHHRTVPPSKVVNELATSMKLTDEQLGMIPRYGTLCKLMNIILASF